MFAAKFKLYKKENMLKKIFISFFISIIIFSPKSSFAWGKKGHQIIGNLASHFLTDSTRKKVKTYLGKYSFAEASTWMDDSRSNDYFNYMRTWHYINLDKDSVYRPSSERNILTVLHAAISELRKNKNLKKKQIQQNLLLIFHLIGDLHQPLHVGYASDRGGNDIGVSYMYKSYNSNLHSVWDTDLIDSEGITIDSCLQMFNTLSSSDLANIKKINELQWFKESRAIMPGAYNFKNSLLDKTYIFNNKTIIERQMLVAGIRLAAVLEELFKK